MNNPATLETGKYETVIRFPNWYNINQATKKALEAAGFVPMMLYYKKRWRSTSAEPEQAQRLVNAINAGTYEQQKDILAPRRKYESAAR